MHFNSLQINCKGKRVFRSNIVVSYFFYTHITIISSVINTVAAGRDASFNLVKNADGSVRGMTFTDTWNNITYAGSKIDRSLSYAKIDVQLANIIVYDSRQDDEPIRLQPEQAKPFNIDEAFDFSQVSGGTQNHI